MMWILDLEQCTEQDGTGTVDSIVPDKTLPTDKFRAVPLRCIAALGQALRGYMEFVAVHDESSKHFALYEVG